MYLYIVIRLGILYLYIVKEIIYVTHQSDSRRFPYVFYSVFPQIFLNCVMRKT